MMVLLWRLDSEATMAVAARWTRLWSGKSSGWKDCEQSGEEMRPSGSGASGRRRVTWTHYGHVHRVGIGVGQVAEQEQRVVRR